MESGKMNSYDHLSDAKRRLLEKRLQGRGKKLGEKMGIPKRRKKPTIPVSFAQERLWLVQQFQQDPSVYNMSAAVWMTGKLNQQALEKSLQEIVDRHESLRTIFPIQESQVVQQIQPELPLNLQVQDFSQTPSSQWKAEMDRIAKEEARKPFDLEKGPLFRFQLLTFSQDEQVLLLTFHHLIFDGWSVGVFFRELTALYEAHLKGKSSPLPELPIQYGDYVLWQREQLDEERLESLFSYWKNQLNGLSTLELPTDRPRPPVQSFKGKTKIFSLPNHLIKKLESLSQRENITLFMTLLAGFKSLLYRYTHQEDLVIGTPIANRNRKETEPLIGLMLNTLVLRTHLEDQLTFRQLLSRVRQTVIQAYEHQDFPFEKLVERLQLERDLSRHPLFQVMFVLQEPVSADLKLSDLRMRLIGIDTETAKFDLNVWIEEWQGEWRATWEYNTDLFDDQTIERMAIHYERLLEAIVHEPDQPISSISFLTENEKQILIEEWGRGPDVLLPDVAVHHIIEQQVEKNPGCIAVVFEEKSISYHELNQRANQLAHYLREQGVTSQTLVGVLMERSIEMVVSLLGILKAGGAYVPIDPNYPKKRIEYVLDDSRVSIVLTQSRLRSLLPNDRLAICMDEADAQWKQASVENPQVSICPDDLIYVIYTSGSTGNPKGAMNTHRGVLNRLLWMQRAYQLNEGDRVLQKTPFGFDVSVWEFFWPLMTGARLVVAKPEGHKDPDYLINLIEQQGITTIHFVPSMLQFFLQRLKKGQCKSLRRVICSGEALTAELQAKFFEKSQAKLINLYGPTEAAVDVTEWVCEPSENRGWVPIGRPIDNTQVYVLDSHKQLVPIGVPGELYIGGVQVGKGYHQRSELTKEKFIPDPFSIDPQARLYQTGDLVRWRDGYLEFLGRIDFQVKIRGFRIELGEIESLLDQYPGVLQSVVIADEIQKGDQQLVAYLSTREPIESVNLKRYLQQFLPEYMVPAYYVFLDALPLNHNGKVDRRALPKPDQSHEQKRSYVEPKTTLEKALAIIWADSLKIQQVGLYDSFFELGGHSILAGQMLIRLEEIFRIRIPLLHFFKQPTIAGMVEEMHRDVQKRHQVEKTAEVFLRLMHLSEEEAANLLESKTSKVREEEQ